MDAASAPYEDANSAWKVLQGKIGLGRSQDQNPTPQQGGAPPSDLPPVTSPDAPPPNLQTNRDINVGAGEPAQGPTETPTWPSDISMRFPRNQEEGPPPGGNPPEQNNPAVDVTWRPSNALRGDGPAPTGRDQGMTSQQTQPVSPRGSGASGWGRPAGAPEPNPVKDTANLAGSLAGALVSYLQSPAAQSDWLRTHADASGHHLDSPMPQSVQDANSFSDALFQGQLGAAELDIAVKAVGEIIGPRIPGALESLKAYIAALKSDEAGMARLDYGLSGPDPLDALGKLTDDQLGTLKQLGPEQKDIATEIERRRVASGLGDALASAGKGPDAQTVRGSVGPTIVNLGDASVTPESLAQTFNDKPWFHGSGESGISSDSLSSLKGDPARLLMGNGVYLTDNSEVAGTYAVSRGKQATARKVPNASPTVYKAQLNLSKVLDGERALSSSEVSVMMKGVHGEVRDILQETLKPDDSAATFFKKLLDATSEHSLGTMTPKSEYYDQFAEIVDNLRKLGYDGIAYKGGVRTGSKTAHNALVLLDPNSEISTGRKGVVSSFGPQDSFDQIVGDAGKVTPVANPQPAFSQKGAMALPETPVSPTEGAPATRPIRYPSEENLGIPAGYKNLPQNLQDSIEQFAREHYAEVQTARGGVVPMSQIEAESLQIQIDAGLLSQTSSRTLVSAPGGRALIKANVKVQGERDALMAAAKESWPNVPDELQARIAVKIFEQNSIQKVIAGARAEWGRLGQVWQTALATGDAVKMRDTYASIQKALGGKAQLDEVIARLHAIENDPLLFGDPYAKGKIALRSTKYIDGITPDATTMEKLDEVYRNAILSIPVTHETYTLGMALYHEAEAIIGIPKAMIDALVAPVERSGLLGKAVQSRRLAEGTYSLNRALARFAAAQTGIPRGLSAAFHSVVTSDMAGRVSAFDEGGKYIEQRAVKNIPLPGGLILPIGDIINAPSKVIEAYTRGFHETARWTEMVDQATAIAEREMPGKSVLNRDFMKRVVEIATNPHDALAPKAPGLTAATTEAAQRKAIRQAEDMMFAAEAAGKKASLRGLQLPQTGRIGELSTHLRGIRDIGIPMPFGQGDFKPIYRVMPFINITANIVTQGLEYSPLGFVNAARLSGQARSAAIAKAGLATMYGKYFWDKADAGELTGALPTDPNDQAQWSREGKTPYSMLVNGQWYAYERFEPLSFSIKWISGMHDAIKDYNTSPDPLTKGSLQVAGGKIAHAIAQSFTDMTWNIGISQLMNITRSGPGDYLGKQVASQIPFSGLLRYAADAYDPYKRTPRGFIQQLEVVMPGLSALVPKSSPDRYGEDQKRPPSQQGPSQMFNPIRGTPSKSDPVDEELNKHQIVSPDGGTVKTLFMTLAAQDIASFKLNPEEGRLMQTYVGRASHQALASLFNDKTPHNGVVYSKLPEADKVKAIQATITEARRVGRSATADAIVQAASTAPEVSRGMEMRLSLISTPADRALYIEGVQQQGKLSTQASALVTARLREKRADSPTVSEYLSAAPGVAAYLAIPAFVGGGPPDELKEVEQERAAYDEQVRIDKLDGTANAGAYYKSHPTLAKYARVTPRTQALTWTIRENPARAQFRRSHPSLGPFLSGLVYTQETP